MCSVFEMSGNVTILSDVITTASVNFGHCGKKQYILFWDVPRAVAIRIFLAHVSKNLELHK